MVIVLLSEVREGIWRNLLLFSTVFFALVSPPMGPTDYDDWTRASLDVARANGQMPSCPTIVISFEEGRPAAWSDHEGQLICRFGGDHATSVDLISLNLSHPGSSESIESSSSRLLEIRNATFIFQGGEWVLMINYSIPRGLLLGWRLHFLQVNYVISVDGGSDESHSTPFTVYFPSYAAHEINIDLRSVDCSNGTSIVWVEIMNIGNRDLALYNFTIILPGGEKFSTDSTVSFDFTFDRFDAAEIVLHQHDSLHCPVVAKGTVRVSYHAPSESVDSITHAWEQRDEWEVGPVPVDKSPLGKGLSILACSIITIAHLFNIFRVEGV